MESILILCDPVQDKIEFRLSYHVNCIYPYKRKNIITKVIRNNSYFIKDVLVSELMDIDHYTYIIVFDTMYKPGLIRIIRKRNSHARLILYFRNTIQSLKNVHWKFSYDEMNRYNAEIWSYSRKDCDVYGFQYNAQFINTHLLEELHNEEYKYDLVFIGKEKNRTPILRSLYEECERCNLKSFFYVKGGGKEKYNTNQDNEYLLYDLYLKKYASQSKALLDIVSEENYELTLRPLEALFLKKKLVTNFFDIKNEKFYNASNIFIYDDNLNHLVEFLDTPLEDVSDEIKEGYTCEHWLKTFLLSG